MTSESLREQVEKRIAELEGELSSKGFMSTSWLRIKGQISELEQVLTLIDEKAKVLEALAVDAEDSYYGGIAANAYRKAHALLAGKNTKA